MTVTMEEVGRFLMNALEEEYGSEELVRDDIIIPIIGAMTATLGSFITVSKNPEAFLPIVIESLKTGVKAGRGALN